MSVQATIAKVQRLRKLREERERLLRHRPQASNSAPESLLAFIPWVSPRYEPPRHLQALVARLERALVEPLRLVVSTPPRHGKTETLLHAIAWWLHADPSATVAYVGYAAEFSRSKSRKARMMAQAARVQLADDAARLEEWRTTAGGGVLATGIGGPLTGHGVNVLVVDDPVKNRVEAESATMRERTWEWFNDVGFTRIEPGGSAVVVQTRWHPDDLAGRLIEQGWEKLRLPAIDDDGNSLWPARWPPEKLLEIRKQVGEYTWASLYQGEPRARGGAVFAGAHIYPEIPGGDRREAIGVDLAYSAKTHSDYSAAVVLRAVGGRFYVVEVVRRQVQAPEFAEALAALQKRYPAARLVGYVAGTEMGTVQLIRSLTGVHIDATPPRGDKFVRAQPVAAAWNAGDVLVPAAAAWVNPFVSELADFTGVKDPHDDQVDALAAAYDALASAGDGYSFERVRSERSTR